MSVDVLQKKIRKLKNPSMLLFTMDTDLVPLAYLDVATDALSAYGLYAKALLETLKDCIPAVRFDFSTFALWGTEGLELLTQLLACAKEQGYYILLDAPANLTPKAAVLSADALTRNWAFDGLLLNCYVGSDGVKPFVEVVKDSEQDLFFALRSANKSAPELQDLLTGTRLVYTVAADMAKRLGEDLVGRCGYSRIAGVGPATSAESLQLLRSKYPAMFFMIDGYDYSGANAKNCSFAFDQLGHGAIACAGESILGAWQEETGSPVELALQAAERMKKNLTRYIAIL